MIKSAARFFLTLFAVCFLAAPLHAADLSADDVERYLETMPQVQLMTEGMRAEGKANIIDEAMKRDLSENFSPHVKGVGLLKKNYPPEYNTLMAVVNAQGFASPESWAVTADQVNLAYMAIQMAENPPQGLEAMQSMSPEAMRQLPPEAQAQMERTIVMMRSFEKVPAEHMEIVRPYVSQIDEVLRSRR